MLLFYHSLLAHIQAEIQAIHAGAVQHSDHNRAVLLLNETAGILDIVAEQAIIYIPPVPASAARPPIT